MVAAVASPKLPVASDVVLKNQRGGVLRPANAVYDSQHLVVVESPR